MSDASIVARGRSRLSALLMRLVRVQRVFIFEGRGAAASPLRTQLGPVRIFVAGVEELPAFRPQVEQAMGVAPRVFDDRLAKGSSLLLATHEQRVVAMLWMTFRDQPVSEVGVTLKPCSGEFITYHAYTLPPYRRQGISTALNRLAWDYAESKGAVRQLAWRRTNNRAALRVAEKLGQRCIATATAVWILGHRVYFAWESVSDSVLDLLA
jgi:GNAT superfamily N-acetyltransferase